MKKTETKTYTIDASGLALGRVASAAAKALMGKNEASFERHIAADTEVTIINASKIKIDPRKLETVKYEHYSGYPGGLRQENLKQVIDKKGIEEALRRAIKGMLPANRLRPVVIKNLIVKE